MDDKTTKRFASYDGFTLIELIVVVAIMGVIAAIALPTLLTTLHRMRVDQAAGQIIWDMKHAKSAAIRTRGNCLVSFGTGGTYTAVIGTNTVINMDINDRYPDIRFYRNDGGGSDPITFNGDNVTFQPTGKTSGIGGSLYIMPSQDISANRMDRMRKITIISTGRVKVYKYINGSWQ